jgi:hypothetical protein
MQLSVTNEQCSQVRDPVCRVIQNYVLQQAKRASTLFRFIFAHLVVRVEFLKQGRKEKTCWAKVVPPKWVGTCEPRRVIIKTQN